MTLTVIHARLASSMILFAGAIAVWGLITFLRGKKVDGNFWGILAIGELLFLVQMIIGIILLVNGESPGRSIHLLYGAAAILTIPGYFALSKGRDDRPAALIYALIAIFVIGIGFRAISTGV
jgi:hypothetical protein